MRRAVALGVRPRSSPTPPSKKTILAEIVRRTPSAVPTDEKVSKLYATGLVRMQRRSEIHYEGYSKNSPLLPATGEWWCSFLAISRLSRYAHTKMPRPRTGHGIIIDDIIRHLAPKNSTRYAWLKKFNLRFVLSSLP
jgi:hypothetical protein